MRFMLFSRARGTTITVSVGYRIICGNRMWDMDVQNRIVHWTDADPVGDSPGWAIRPVPRLGWFADAVGALLLKYYQGLED
ncbi:MAG TPA: hypothetical protein VN667_12855, partial [Burkholderiales bacterium]|nr:hypothetical protein [Burkholderiales bacterium]